MIRPVIIFYDPILRSVAAPADGQTAELCADLIDTMLHHNGLGLAAPQIGISKRVFVARDPNKPAAIYTFVNPKLYPQRRKKEVEVVEWCLSIPGVFVRVPRYTEIMIVERTVRIKASGMFAAVLLHEMDHLDSKLII